MASLVLGVAGAGLGGSLLGSGISLFGATITGAQIGGALGALAGDLIDRAIAPGARSRNSAIASRSCNSRSAMRSAHLIPRRSRRCCPASR